ncbi:hypothetical protein Goarm_020680, partial [Gossypium armourianum]|nr:hypothetical protein [Gossypium armourianum]
MRSDGIECIDYASASPAQPSPRSIPLFVAGLDCGTFVRILLFKVVSVYKRFDYNVYTTANEKTSPMEVEDNLDSSRDGFTVVVRMVELGLGGGLLGVMGELKWVRERAKENVMVNHGEMVWGGNGGGQFSRGE